MDNIKEIREEYERLKYFDNMGAAQIEAYQNEMETYKFHYKRITNEQNNIRDILKLLTAKESETAKEYRDDLDNLEHERQRYIQLMESWERADKEYKRYLYLKSVIEKHNQVRAKVIENENKKPFVHDGSPGEQLSLF